MQKLSSQCVALSLKKKKNKKKFRERYTYKKKEIKENNQILDDFSSSLHVKIYLPMLKLRSRKFKINISNLKIYYLTIIIMRPKAEWAIDSKPMRARGIFALVKSN